MEKPLIFITNDDGIHAKGLKRAIEIGKKFGDVLVVAPNGPRSAQSSALTIDSPIWIEKLSEEAGCTQYICSGTPADCVKIGLDKIVTRKPNLLISGINHGSNISINIIYSGTMGAALEGSLHNILSVGLSLKSHDADADFSEAEPYFESIINELLKNKLPANTCLNINAPEGKIKGIKVCRQSHGRWANEYLETEVPRPRKYFWLVGDFTNAEPMAEDTDIWAVKQQYISVVPIQTDYTDYNLLTNLQKIEK